MQNADIHREESFHVAVSTVRKRSDKYIDINGLACFSVEDTGCVTSPVNLHDLAGLVIQVHCGVLLGAEVVVVLVELRGLIRQLTVLTALLYIFPPEQIQRHAAAMKLLVHILIIRHLVLLLPAADGNNASYSALSDMSFGKG